jgi:hypothetical protein
MSVFGNLFTVLTFGRFLVMFIVGSLFKSLIRLPYIGKLFCRAVIDIGLVESHFIAVSVLSS